MAVVSAAAVIPGDQWWGEMNVTWDTAPESGPAFATWTAAEGRPVEFDVTALVQQALAGDRRLALRVFAPNYKRGGSHVQYGAREGAPDARPQLLITTARDAEARRPDHRPRAAWFVLRKDA